MITGTAARVGGKGKRFTESAWGKQKMTSHGSGVNQTVEGLK
jgi:hypothetical protein